MRRLRLVLVSAAFAVLALPGSAAAFHHGAIPASDCANSEQASANPTARQAILERNPHFNPGRGFPPFGTPGEGQGQGDERCAGAG